MELQIPSISFILISVLFFFLLKARAQFQRTKWPPGPTQLPIIGSMHHLFTKSRPHRVLQDLSLQYGPLMHLKLGELNVIVASSPEMTKAVTMTHDINFAFRPDTAAGRILTYDNTSISSAPYGGYWRQMRKICILELLSAQRVKAFHPIRAEELGHLMLRITAANGSPINLTWELLRFTNAMTSKALFGVECNQLGVRFIVAVKKLLELFSAFNIADYFPSLSFMERLTGLRSRMMRVRAEMDEIFDQLIESHELKKSDMDGCSEEEMEKEGILDALLRVKARGDMEFPLTMDNVKSVLLDLFTGGTDTSATTLTWAMVELMRNPRVMQKAQKEVRQALKDKSSIEEDDLKDLHYLKLIIKETLRLHIPITLLLPRIAKEECRIGEYEVPAGTRVLINAWAMAKDPKSWENPESFLPERFERNPVDFKGTNYEFIPFGAGRRMCPGISFGVANMEIALAQLLFYFNWELPHGVKAEELDMTENVGVTASRKEDLYLVATPYAPLPTF
ncbi:hypothetical protein J5N97_022342 [Dioscorea zingiberensis]|uniref:Cytochrome P450 n=1 Tax=Dioscorea zingiberensis TaxID=325984 RepID=A0A9D5HAS5_9LILI|nr:hypothetical protein J5N97_022342 [Dioscorea zingiberensis]